MNPTSTFTLNGRTHALGSDAPTESLLRWLRRNHLTGTKEGCGDGDCGACTVVLVESNGANGSRFVAVNSCLLPVGVLPGREVLTVESIADGDNLHPVQRAMVEHRGSQCGYCTPGFVMSLFAGYYGGELSDHTTEGNLCRCTGYRSIRDATTALRLHPREADRFDALLHQPRESDPAAALSAFHSPATLEQALALKAQHPDAAFIAGGTDLGVNLSRGQTVAPVFIALDRIAELHDVRIDESQARIGAGVPLSRIEHELAGMFPALDDLLPWFAARQVRNRATIGGNLGSASPIGDLAPVLLALDAVIELVGPAGRREVPVAGFFLDYRKTVRAPDEIITAVVLPRRSDVVQGCYKIAKRQTDDISIVAAVFALARDAEGVVTHARLAFGGVAATPVRAREVEAELIGKPLDAAAVEATRAALMQVFSPLSDHRASADYRRALCGSLFAKFVRERLGVEGAA
ncbi:FAD binding domain-containing protein [Xanthomonadaceae bacterium JHOS43]|nr:FAD binding domain-containing protein [Xanthomonadaceae bacterium JHOS43]MCX7562376.1 FAD binding domain-containing protein [Xanthomonadaceae bacterium XH05]